MEKQEIAKRLGAVLAGARRARGLSQAALGRALGLGQGTVSKMEAGLAVVSVPLLCRWAHLLGTEPWLLLAEAVGSAEDSRALRAVFELSRTEPRAWSTMRLLLTRPVRDTVP